MPRFFVTLQKRVKNKFLKKICNRNNVFCNKKGVKRFIVLTKNYYIPLFLVQKSEYNTFLKHGRSKPLPYGGVVFGSKQKKAKRTAFAVLFALYARQSRCFHFNSILKSI